MMCGRAIWFGLAVLVNSACAVEYFVAGTEPVPYCKAREVCAAHAGVLATIRSKAENDKALKVCSCSEYDDDDYYDSYYDDHEMRETAGPCWIGMQELAGTASTEKKKQTWAWIDGKFDEKYSSLADKLFLNSSNVKGQKSSYSNWGGDEPNNHKGCNEKAVGFNLYCEGSWYDVSKSDYLVPLCEKDRDSPGGTSVDKIRDLECDQEYEKCSQRFCRASNWPDVECKPYSEGWNCACPPRFDETCLSEPSSTHGEPPVPLDYNGACWAPARGSKVSNSSRTNVSNSLRISVSASCYSDTVSPKLTGLSMLYKGQQYYEFTCCGNIEREEFDDSEQCTQERRGDEEAAWVVGMIIMSIVVPLIFACVCLFVVLIKLRENQRVKEAQRQQIMSQQRQQPHGIQMSAISPSVQMRTMQIQVPAGVGPGSTLQVQIPDGSGRRIQLRLPANAVPGQLMQVQYQSQAVSQPQIIAPTVPPIVSTSYPTASTTVPSTSINAVVASSDPSQAMRSAVPGSRGVGPVSMPVPLHNTTNRQMAMATATPVPLANTDGVELPTSVPTYQQPRY